MTIEHHQLSPAAPKKVAHTGRPGENGRTHVSPREEDRGGECAMGWIRGAPATVKLPNKRSVAAPQEASGASGAPVPEHAPPLADRARQLPEQEHVILRNTTAPAMAPLPTQDHALVRPVHAATLAVLASRSCLTATTANPTAEPTIQLSPYHPAATVKMRGRGANGVNGEAPIAIPRSAASATS